MYEEAEFDVVRGAAASPRRFPCGARPRAIYFNRTFKLSRLSESLKGPPSNSGNNNIIGISIIGSMFSYH